jgi:hypothetical protein
MDIDGCTSSGGNKLNGRLIIEGKQKVDENTEN